MKNRELIGLVGSKESTERVAKALIKNFGVPPSSMVGDIYLTALEIISPKEFKGIVSETVIRQMANKVGATISVTKYAGKKVDTEDQQSEYLVSLADKYATRGWAAKLFVDTDFFRKKTGKYIAQVTRKEDSDFLTRDLGVDYRTVMVYDSIDEKPESEDGAHIVVGNSTGKELNERISKAFTKLESKGVKK
jgi:hypothetical protein